MHGKNNDDDDHQSLFLEAPHVRRVTRKQTSSLKIVFLRASCFGFRVKGVCQLLFPLVSLGSSLDFLISEAGCKRGSNNKKDKALDQKYIDLA